MMSVDESLHSRRPLTLRFDIPISKTREFWEALGKGRMTTTKCSSCGHVSFPPQKDCPSCFKGDPSWVDLGTDAKLVTFTHVQMPPATFAEYDPYTIAIAEFPMGVRVLAWLEGVDHADAKPGLKLKVEVRKTEGGVPYYVFVRA